MLPLLVTVVKLTVPQGGAFSCLDFYLNGLTLINSRL